MASKTHTYQDIDQLRCPNCSTKLGEDDYIFDGTGVNRLYNCSECNLAVKVQILQSSRVELIY